MTCSQSNGWLQLNHFATASFLAYASSAAISLSRHLRTFSRLKFSLSSALRNLSVTGMYSLYPSRLTNSRFFPTNVQRLSPMMACFFTIPKSFKNTSGSVSAGKILPNTAARLGVRGRRAHHTCNLCTGGCFPTASSLFVSAPTCWQGNLPSINFCWYSITSLPKLS